MSSCTRYDNYLKFVDQKKLLEESVTFGLEYKAMLALPISETSLRTSLILAADKESGLTLCCYFVWDLLLLCTNYITLLVSGLVL